jgi:hypothetical protein
MWKQSQYNPNYPHLIELAYDVTKKDITLKTDCGWFDHAELHLSWDGTHFEATVTTYVEAGYCPATLYEPSETDYAEASETARFRKIRELDQWAKASGFDINSARRAK